MFFKPEDLYAVGQGGGDLVKGLATDIANNVCDLYEQSPASFGIPNPAGDAVTALSSGVWDSFCGRLPEPKIPSAPSVPFSGGQCCGRLYTAYYTVSGQNGDGSSYTVDEQSTWRGRLINLSMVANAPNSSPGVNRVKLEYADCSGNVTVTYGQYGLTIGSIQIVPIDGPDDCGDLEPGYPPPSVPVSNPRTYNHTGNDGVERPINYTINFPGVGFSPTIDLPDLPDLNIPVRIDATGIEINIPVGIGVNDENGGLTDDNLEDILAGAKAATRVARTGDRVANGGGNNEGGTGEDGIEGFYGVYFDAITIPTWFGKVFGSPVKYRLGRISFKRDGYHLRDEDILFSKQYFIAPSDANGYVATYEPEVVGKITVIREIEE